METNNPRTQSGEAPPRTGPIGRTTRAVGAFTMAVLAYEWIEAGMAWFSQPSTAANPMVWLVIVLAVFVGLHLFPDFTFGRPWGRRVVIGFAWVLTVLIVVTIEIHGELWATPLTGLLYGLGVSFLVAVALSFLLASFLGTPGCELGGLTELIRSARTRSRSNDNEAMWCVAGLHNLDEWEAGRRGRTSR